MQIPKPGHQDRIEFALESVENGIARGWVRDRIDNDRRLQVVLMVDGEIFTDWADINRPELSHPNASRVDCGFCISFGQPEFKSFALLVDGLCLHAEVAAPPQLPAPPAELDVDAVNAQFAPGWRERPMLLMFADQVWDKHPGRARQLAHAVAAFGWDVAYVEPVFRNCAGLRAQAGQANDGGRVCRIVLPASSAWADLSEARIERHLCLRWKDLLQALVRDRPHCASLYCGARWVELMRVRPVAGPCLLDLEHDPCSPSPWRLTPGQFQDAVAAADELTLASRHLPLPPAAASKPQHLLRNGFDPELLPLACGVAERRYLFGASAVLDRLQGARWLRDFLQANPGLPAVLAGGGVLAPIFAQLAQSGTGLSYVGAASPLVAGFCLSRSRFCLLATGGAPWCNPSALYESLTLGVPVLGPFAPDCEDELRAAFTTVTAAQVQPLQLNAAQERFDAVRANVDLSRYGWNARARQLLEVLEQALDVGSRCAKLA